MIEKMAEILKDKLETSSSTIKDGPNRNFPEIKDRMIEPLSEKPISKDIESKLDYTSLKEKLGTEEIKNSELTSEEKEIIREEQDWSDETIDAIGSMEEYEIYKEAGLKEEEINGKKCLVKEDLDMEQTDERGRTNRERMKKGLSPIDKNGETVELHHIGQKADSPLAELNTSEHRGKGNDGVLHDKTKESEIDRVEFKKEKEAHWESRV